MIDPRVLGLLPNKVKNQLEAYAVRPTRAGSAPGSTIDP